MERPDRIRLAGQLALLAGGFLFCTQGCRSTKSEVPAGKPYQTSGTPPTVGFSTEPHPNTSTGMAGLYGNKAPGALVSDGRGSSPSSGGTVFGTPPPASANLGVPTNNAYGPPGTAGSGSSSLGPQAAPADSLLKTMAPVSQVLSKDPATLPGSAGSPGGGYP